jgi:nucleoside 2-deoxyribosyltransferase
MKLEFNNKCLITGLDAEQVNMQKDMVFSYRIKVNGKWITLNFWEYIEKWMENGKELDDLKLGVGDITLNQAIYLAVDNARHILCGILLNNNWPLRVNEVLSLEKINEVLLESNYPKSPKEKKEYVFNKLYLKNTVDGQYNNLETGIKNFDAYKYYLKSMGEYKFYIEDLKNDGYISLFPKSLPRQYQITYKGLNYGISLNEEGYNSNLCFVAMSFDEKDLEIYTKAIKPACEKWGFESRRIDEEHYDPEKTINDAMIALMKKAKFCIADFSRQKHGAYFEAGYCLGKGKKVIYTCHKKFFKRSHFDTNHFPHIVYNSLDELREGLIKKIEAWVI